MDWCSKNVKEVFSYLKTSEKGLTEKEAKKRLKQYGRNVIKKTHRLRPLKIFFEQFNSLFIYILIFASIISFFIDNLIDSIVILAIVFLNAGIGFIQQYKAEKAVSKLKSLLISKTKVLRDSKMREIPSSKIVPGDLIILNAGDAVNADCRIIEEENLEVNEAVLTGESSPVSKFSKTIMEKVSLVERKNLLFTGTKIVKGTSKALVISTGMDTEFGKIAESLQEIKIQKTPMQKILNKFSKKLGLIISGLVVIIVLVGLLKNSDFFEIFMTSVALAVGAIPEGLPTVLAIAFSVASRTMFKKNVIIRRLSAVESLGSVTVICSDKTGTITEEKMDVQKIFINNKVYTKKEKELFLNNKKINLKENSELSKIFKTSILCNNARFELIDGRYNIIGDPTEEALLSASLDLGLNKKIMIEKEPSVTKFEFDSKRKMMSVLRKNGKENTLYSKGAPEKIVTISKFELINGKIKRLTKKRKKELIDASKSLEKDAYRVLSFGYRNFKKKEKTEEKDLIFLGFLGMIDPPRKEVKNAVEKCINAGIKIKMVTGDSILTAKAIAEQVGIKGKSLVGDELEKMKDSELFNSIEEISIFARINPEQKLRITKILQSKGEIVAITGDGVNDVLALKSADIGIAMGKKGTDVSRDVSDVVLVDDNFASIVEGVKQGRKIYDNLKKFIRYLLTVNFSEVFLVLASLILSLPLPLLPLHILWMNLITDTLPALTLVFEKEERVMNTKPRKEKNILNRILKFILIGGIINFFACFLVYMALIKSAPIEHVRTMVLTTGILFELFFIYTCRSNKSLLEIGIFSNKYLNYSVIFSFFLHLLIIYTPASILFSLTSLSLGNWLFIIPFSVSGLIIFEIAKVIRKK